METEKIKVDDYYIDQLIDQAFANNGYFLVNSGRWFARLENRVYTYKGPKKDGKSDKMTLHALKGIFHDLISTYLAFEANGYFYHYYNGEWKCRKKTDL